MIETEYFDEKAFLLPFFLFLQNEYNGKMMFGILEATDSIKITLPVSSFPCFII